MSLLLSDNEALAFLRNWKPASDVYAFQHGQNVLTAATTLSAMYINFKFRRALKLQNFAFVSTYCATVFIPSVASSFFHGMLVVKPMLSREVQCPVCLETRSSLSQVMCSVIYPVILSPLACIPFADRYMTKAVPSIVNEPILALKHVVKILKPIRKRLLIITAAQVVIGGALAHCELKNLITVVEKVQLMEEELSSRVSEEKMKSIREAAKFEDFSEMLDAGEAPRKHIFS